MTEPEVWKALEDHFRTGCTDGIQVLADWFAEKQESDLAATLRWMTKWWKKLEIICDRQCFGRVPSDLNSWQSGHLKTADSVRDFVYHYHHNRLSILDSLYRQMEQWQ